MNQRLGAGDGTDQLCRALYHREARPKDYLGGGDAQMLKDAASLLTKLANARVRVQAIWKRERERRQRAEAERDDMMALYRKEHEANTALLVEVAELAYQLGVVETANSHAH